MTFNTRNNFVYVIKDGELRSSARTSKLRNEVSRILKTSLLKPIQSFLRHKKLLCIEKSRIKSNIKHLSVSVANKNISHRISALFNFPQQDIVRKRIPGTSKANSKKSWEFKFNNQLADKIKLNNIESLLQKIMQRRYCIRKRNIGTTINHIKHPLQVRRLNINVSRPRSKRGKSYVDSFIKEVQKINLKNDAEEEYEGLFNQVYND